MRLLALAASAVFLGFPSAAFSATASANLVPPGFAYDGAGEANQVSASYAGGVVDVRDTGATITPGAGCVAVDAHEVNCPVPGLKGLHFFLGSGTTVS